MFLVITRTFSFLTFMNKTIIAALVSGLCGMAHAQDAAELPVVTVFGSSAVRASTVDSAADTTHTDIGWKDYPASIQTVPTEVLKDRGVTRIDQVVETVSGVHAESNYGGNGATFFNIRGFSESNGLRDGFRNYGYYAFRDVQNIDQVDVFKGPAGALYGGIGAVGGYINTVSKRPQRENVGEIGVTAGTQGLARTTLDLNRVVDENLSVRLNAAVERGSGYRDNTDYDSWSVAPSIRWDDHRGNAITLLTEFNHLRRDGFDAGIPAVANYQSLSRTRYYGLLDGTYPGVTGDNGKNDTQAATLLIEHALSDQWKLRLSMQYVNARQLSTQSFPNSTTATGNLLDYSVYGNTDEASRQYGIRAELAGDVTLAGLRHQLLAGADYGYLEVGSRGSTVSTMTLDLFNPNYVSALTAGDPLQSHQGRGKDYGLYVMDQVTLTPEIKAMLALRADRFVNESLQSDVIVGRGEQSALSPRLGLVWQPWKTTSLFADWSRSHAPNVGHTGPVPDPDRRSAGQDLRDRWTGAPPAGRSPGKRGWPAARPDNRPPGCARRPSWHRWRSAAGRRRSRERRSPVPVAGSSRTGNQGSCSRASRGHGRGRFPAADTSCAPPSDDGPDDVPPAGLTLLAHGPAMAAFPARAAPGSNPRD